MGRRAKPQKGEADTAKRALARKSPKGEGAKVRDLEKRLAEAQEQQAGTAEILRVISSSPTNVQPVFDAIASSALRLCDGVASFVFRHDGTLIHLAAVDSVEGSTCSRCGTPSRRLRSARPSPAAWWRRRDCRTSPTSSMTLMPHQD